MMFLRASGRPAARMLGATIMGRCTSRTAVVSGLRPALLSHSHKKESAVKWFMASARMREDGKAHKSPRETAGEKAQNSQLAEAGTASSVPSAPKSAISDPTLHEDIYTIPNILTFTRIVAAPFVGYCILHDQHAWAVGLFAYAGITDMLDGWIARKWNTKTVVGTVIDPMADKALMTILTVCLAVKGLMPVWVAGIILGRDIGLAIAAIYFRWISLPPPKTFTRYWDFSLPSAEVKPTTISKYNTFLQLILVGATTAAPLAGFEYSSALTILQYIVATTTVWSGASYIYTKDAVKILNQATKKP